MGLSFDVIVKVIRKLQHPPGEEIPAGATEDCIQRFETDVGFVLPEELKTWLKLCNGPCVGPGGIFGLQTKRKGQDIRVLWEWHPDWKEQGWIPIAGDGCGNYYVLLSMERAENPPVGFIEPMEGNRIALIVASDLIHFLSFYVEKEQGVSGWPFRKKFVIRKDPRIELYSHLNMPWTTE